MPAPTVKPTMTLCETYLVKSPRRSSAIPSCTTPARKESNTVAETRSPSGTTARALSSAMERTLVGPLMSCRDESKRAPTAVITMAVNSPYCGGNPASMA